MLVVNLINQLDLSLLAPKFLADSYGWFVKSSYSVTLRAL